MWNLDYGNNFFWKCGGFVDIAIMLDTLKNIKLYN